MPVALAEDTLAQALFAVGRQLDPALPRQLEQRLDPQRPVEVDVQIGLRQAADQLEVHALSSFGVKSCIRT